VNNHWPLSTALWIALALAIVPLLFGCTPEPKMPPHTSFEVKWYNGERVVKRTAYWCPDHGRMFFGEQLEEVEQE